MNMLSRDAENIAIEINELHGRGRRVEICISDDGRIEERERYAISLDEEIVQGSPGIQALSRIARGSAGSFKINRPKGGGLRVSAVLDLAHESCPPLGDLARMMMCLTAANPFGQIKLQRKSNRRQYHYDTADLRARLHKMSLQDPQDIMRIRGEMSECERMLRAS